MAAIPGDAARATDRRAAGRPRCTLRLSERGNAEVLFLWLRIADPERIQAGLCRPGAVPHIAGPAEVRRAAVHGPPRTPAGRTEAGRIYARARPLYHTSARQALDVLLDPVPDLRDRIDGTAHDPAVECGRSGVELLAQASSSELSRGEKPRRPPVLRRLLVGVRNPDQRRSRSMHGRRSRGRPEDRR